MYRLVDVQCRGRSVPCAFVRIPNILENRLIKINAVADGKTLYESAVFNFNDFDHTFLLRNVYDDSDKVVDIKGLYALIRYEQLAFVETKVSFSLLFLVNDFTSALLKHLSFGLGRELGLLSVLSGRSGVCLVHSSERVLVIVDRPYEDAYEIEILGDISEFKRLFLKVAIMNGFCMSYVFWED